MGWSINALVEVEVEVEDEVLEGFAKTMTLVEEDTIVVMVVAAVGVDREVTPSSPSSRLTWRARSTGRRLRGARISGIGTLGIRVKNVGLVHQ
jgi:hypothetical protein